MRVAVERDPLCNLTALETITVGYLDLKEAGLVRSWRGRHPGHRDLLAA